jgi:hypothetical protein
MAQRIRPRYHGVSPLAGGALSGKYTRSNAGQNTSDRAALLEGFLNEKTYEVCRRTRDRRHDAPDQCRQRGAGLAPCPAGRHVDHHWGAPAEHAADGPGHHPRRNDGQRASGHGRVRVDLLDRTLDKWSCTSTAVDSGAHQVSRPGARTASAAVVAALTIAVSSFRPAPCRRLRSARRRPRSCCRRTRETKRRRRSPPADPSG